MFLESAATTLFPESSSSCARENPGDEDVAAITSRRCLRQKLFESLDLKFEHEGKLDGVLLQVKFITD